MKRPFKRGEAFYHCNPRSNRWAKEAALTDLKEPPYEFAHLPSIKETVALKLRPYHSALYSFFLDDLGEGGRENVLQQERRRRQDVKKNYNSTSTLMWLTHEEARRLEEEDRKKEEWVHDETIKRANRCYDKHSNTGLEKEKPA
jgi:hypothetical protein